MPAFRITKCSHHFVVSELSYQARYAVIRFALRFDQFEWIRNAGSWVRNKIRSFCVDNLNLGEFRFHINSFNDFMQYMHDNNFTSESYTIVERDHKPAAPFFFKIRPEYQPLPKQLESIKFVCEDNGKPSILLQDQTGNGKGFVALTGILHRALRLGIVVRPGFIKKWKDDIAKHTLITEDDIFVIQGSESIEEAIELANVGEYNYGITIISNRTFQSWMRDYEIVQGYRGYGVHPQDFFGHLGIGIRMMDEVHMDFHLMFKMDLYTHVKHAISISAEIDGDDSFENSMALLAYPLEGRTKRQPYHKYVNTTLLTFCFKMPKKLRYQQGRNYNHIKLEESICKHIPTYNAYVKMILDNANAEWRDDYKPGDKLVIFVASIMFATKLVKEAQRYWPGKDVRRYVEQDPFENLMGGDVTITTLLSGGTGHDIPNLSTVALTNSVKATRSNIQGFGRLRYKEGRKRKFLYMACKDIPKQMEYDRAKRDLLRDKTLTFNAIHHPYML